MVAVRLDPADVDVVEPRPVVTAEAGVLDVVLPAVLLGPVEGTRVTGRESSLSKPLLRLNVYVRSSAVLTPFARRVAEVPDGFNAEILP